MDGPIHTFQRDHWRAHIILPISRLELWNYPGKICAFFCKQHLFSIEPQCCLTFSRNKLQTLLKCCLIEISIIILRHYLYLLYLCLCLDPGLVMLYLCDLHRRTCSFTHFLEYVLLFLDDNFVEECEKFSNRKYSTWGCCLAFAWCQFQPGVAYKSVAYKKVCRCFFITKMIQRNK